MASPQDIGVMATSALANQQRLEGSRFGACLKTPLISPYREPGLKR
jgi:hypothetical protein